MSMAFRSLPPPSHFSPWFKHLLRDSNKYFCYFITKVFHKSISSRCFPYLFLASALTSSKHVFSVGLSVAILKSFRLSVQLLSHVRLFATPWIAARQASLSITNSRSSLRLTSIESVMPSSQLILCHPLLLLPPIPPSIRVFSNESTLHIMWKSIGVSASASDLPMNTQDWSSLGWTGWISLQSKGLWRVFSNKSINSSVLRFLHRPTLASIHDHWKNHSLN